MYHCSYTHPKTRRWYKERCTYSNKWNHCQYFMVPTRLLHIRHADSHMRQTTWWLQLHLSVQCAYNYSPICWGPVFEARHLLGTRQQLCSHSNIILLSLLYVYLSTMYTQWKVWERLILIPKLQELRHPYEAMAADSDIEEELPQESKDLCLCLPRTRTIEPLTYINLWVWSVHTFFITYSHDECQCYTYLLHYRTVLL